MPEPRVRPEWRVPDDDQPAARCPHCDRPFTDERRRDLHVGEVHAESCTDAEAAAYEAARDAESDDLFVYHLKIVGGLVALYADLILVYMVVLSV